MPPVATSYLNTLTFKGYTDNIVRSFTDFLKTYESERQSMNLFTRRDVGEDALTTFTVQEQDMQQFAHDKPEGVDAQRLMFGVGYSKTVNATRIGAQLNISYEMRKANRFNIGMAISRFNQSIPNRMELDAQHALLTFANATSYVNMDGRTVDVTGGDGLAAASATHPLALSTATWSNIVPGNPQLSVTALEAAEKLGVTDILDNFGLPAMMKFTHLAVNAQDPQTVRVAQEILRSTTNITQANPGVINTFKQKYDLLVFNYAATDAMGRPDSTKYKWWALLALTGPNRLASYAYVWEAPHLNAVPNATVGNNAIDVYNDDYTWGARARYAFAFTSARGAIYSFPA